MYQGQSWTATTLANHLITRGATVYANLDNGRASLIATYRQSTQNGPGKGRRTAIAMSFDNGRFLNGAIFNSVGAGVARAGIRSFKTLVDALDLPAEPTTRTARLGRDGTVTCGGPAALAKAYLDGHEMYPTSGIPGFFAPRPLMYDPRGDSGDAYPWREINGPGRSANHEVAFGAPGRRVAPTEMTQTAHV